MGWGMNPGGAVWSVPKEHAFVAATYKSGGIHITNGLCFILGWRRSSLSSWQQAGQTEHDINPHVAGNLLPQGAFVFHQHMRAWGTNTDILAWFTIKPIVLVRNLADIIASLRDHCLHPSQSEMNPKGLPGVYIPASFDSMSREQQELFLVRNVGPWLTSFYVSWKSQRDLPCLWVTYEEHFKDQVASFRRMLEWIGHGQNCPDAIIREIADQKPHNFNMGQSGRGRTLHPNAMDALEELIDGWGPEWAPQIRRDLLSWPTSVSAVRQTYSQPSEVSTM